MNRQRSPATALALLLAVACAPSEDPLLDQDRDALDALHERHVEAALAEDLDAFLATVTADSALLPPNDPGARGTEAVRAWFEGFFAAFSIAELEFPTTELHIDQDMAFRHYTYDWTVAPDAEGESISDRGDGLYVYQRQADRTWKISYDLWTSSEPAAGSE